MWYLLPAISTSLFWPSQLGSQFMESPRKRWKQYLCELISFNSTSVSHAAGALVRQKISKRRTAFSIWLAWHNGKNTLRIYEWPAVNIPISFLLQIHLLPAFGRFTSCAHGSSLGTRCVVDTFWYELDVSGSQRQRDFGLRYPAILDYVNLCNGHGVVG